MNNDNISNARPLLHDAMSELNNYKFVAAIRLLRKVADMLADSDISNKIDDVEGRYFFMLRYLSSYALSSDHKDIDDIASKLNDIAALLSRDIAAGDNTAYGAQLRFERLRPEENLPSIISDYLSEAARLRTDTSALTDPKAHAPLERISIDIFNRLWTSYRLEDDTFTLLEDILDDNSIADVDRELWINALALSLFYFHNTNALDLLLKAISNQNRRIHIASIVWLLLIATAFSGDINRDLLQKIWIALHSSDIDIVEIYIQIIRTVSSDNNDLFRDLSSLSQRFRNLDLNDAESIKNIDLSSDDYEKIKRFNEAQASGADVFGQTIGNMRYFPFFDTLANWFIPFDPQHSLLADITDGEGAEIAESIAMMPNIADSDKYAIILSMGQMPIHLRSKALSTLVDGMRSMSDLPEFRDALSEIINVPDSTLIANQLLQISRFVSKFPKIHEFPIAEVWNVAYLLAPEHLLPSGIEKVDYIRLAKALFDHSNVSAARFLANSVIDDIQIDSLSLDQLEFLAIISDKPVALDCFKEILIREPARLDIAVSLARRYIDLQSFDKAVAVLNDAGVENSGDIEALLCLAHCYEAISDFDRAIDTLYQADYSVSDRDSRPRLRLAELYIKNNLPHEALATIDLIDAKDRNNLPLGSHGIALWLSGNSKDAIAIWLAEIRTLDHDAKLKYIRDLRRNILEMSQYPVGNNSAFIGMCVAPDILLYHIIGSKFGNI